jgi:uncharacterized protein
MPPSRPDRRDSGDADRAPVKSRHFGRAPSVREELQPGNTRACCRVLVPGNQQEAVMQAENTQLVKDAYAAFGRGDIPGLLGYLDDNVEWHAVIGTEGVVPHSGVKHGKPAVAEFFRVLAETTEFQSFEPREFIADDNQVAVIGHYTGRVKSTAKPWDSGWVMVFTIRNGRIVRFREFTDSRQLVAAYQ